MKETLLVATSNRGKLREFEALFVELNLELKSLSQLGFSSVKETGATFEENAALKALNAAQKGQCLALGDDSGLLVDALDGRPGVYSARYAGPSATDLENCSRLLHELADVPLEKRGARFRCALALGAPDQGLLHMATADCEGTIASASRGSSGFGYDPVFIPRGLSHTMAELTAEEKNRLSHRALAMQKLLKWIKKHASLLKLA